MSESQPSQANVKGAYRVDAAALKKRMIAESCTIEGICRKHHIQKRTIRRMLSGGPTRLATINKVASILGVNPTVLVERSEYAPEASGKPEESAPEQSRSAGEWNAIRPVTEVRTASNGLQYRIFQMQHLHQPGRVGRGKRYDFGHLPDDEHARLKGQIVRHPQVCDRVGRHPGVPISYSTYPGEEPGVWWVVDQWIDGSLLAERLDNGSVETLPLPMLARQLAEALAALHAAGIVCRELNPQRVLLRSGDQQAIVTDFELAKLTDGSPTVSDDWPDDQYRAPEVGAGEATPAADLYSWGRIVTHAAIGQLPERGAEAAALTAHVPKGVAAILAACCELRRSKRPQNCAEAIRVAADWERQRRGR